MPEGRTLRIDFVVEAGAELTIISPSDMRRLLRRVPDAAETLRALPQISVSGVGVASYAPAEAVLAFDHEDGFVQSVDALVLCTDPEMSAPPFSLLGCNVLEQFSVRLFGPAAEVILE